MTAQLQHDKATIWAYWQQLDAATSDTLADVVHQYVHPASNWYGPQPINHLAGSDQILAGFWQPLRLAFPDLHRQCDVFLGGQFGGTMWVCGTGYMHGTFTAPWLGISATGAPASIRFGEFCRLQHGQIVESYLLLDLIDLLVQAGRRVLPVSRGDEARVPGPHDGAGLLLGAQDAQAGQQSLQLVEAMIAGLGQYDRSDLRSMNMAAFWHPQMEWYGPGGIGTARGLHVYEAVHARPFLSAFPDRKGGNHKARFGEGMYVASTGWPSVRATHTGDWLGCPATGKPIGMRVMDFWRREGDLLVQNWVLIDIIDIFLQFGVDLFRGQ